jgi:hypothetical protein
MEKAKERPAVPLDRPRSFRDDLQDGVVAADLLRRVAAGTAQHPDENGFTYGCSTPWKWAAPRTAAGKLSPATLMGPLGLVFCQGHGTTVLPVVGPPGVS